MQCVGQAGHKNCFFSLRRYNCTLCIVRSVSNQQQVADSCYLEGPNRKENILIIQTQHKSFRKSHAPTSKFNHFEAFPGRFLQIVCTYMYIKISCKTTILTCYVILQKALCSLLNLLKVSFNLPAILVQ